MWNIQQHRSLEFHLIKWKSSNKIWALKTRAKWIFFFWGGKVEFFFLSSSFLRLNSWFEPFFSFWKSIPWCGIRKSIPLTFTLKLWESSAEMEVSQNEYRTNISAFFYQFYTRAWYGKLENIRIFNSISKMGEIRYGNWCLKSHREKWAFLIDPFSSSGKPIGSSS